MSELALGSKSRFINFFLSSLNVRFVKWTLLFPVSSESSLLLLGGRPFANLQMSGHFILDSTGSNQE